MVLHRGLLVSALTLLVIPSAARAQSYTVHWEPTSVTQTVSTGVTRVVTLTFTSRVPLTDVELVVVPELQSLVSVSPATIATVPPNTSIQVQITIVGTGPSDRTVTGTVRIKRARSSSTEARPLPVTITVAGNGLPPDPGPDGQLTLGGIDSDANGLRDDLQRYIALTYGNSSSTQTALTFIATSFQAALQNAPDKNASLDEARRLQRRIECLYSIRQDAKRVKDALLARVLNTRIRTEAYFQFNHQLEGETFRSTPRAAWAQACSVGGVQ
jgi:hypothetical protein